MFALGVIPARGGSKRLPGKNIRPMAGKPLIAWSIGEANKSQLDLVIVSTDDQKIAEVSKEWGADVPFIRPKELATDEAKSVDVMIHAARWCEEHLEQPDFIFLLQPTSPTRIAAQIDIAVEALKMKVWDSFVTIGPDQKPNGLLYATSWDLLMNDHMVWNGYSLLYACDEEIPDIDTEEDWAKAEALLKCR